MLILEQRVASTQVPDPRNFNNIPRNWTSGKTREYQEPKAIYRQISRLGESTHGIAPETT
jgi:hypothetical protein